MRGKKIFLFVFLKLILIFIISYIASRLIPYLGFFSYKPFLSSYSVPEFVRSLANFDGIYYLRIAKNGYSQYEQVFFPLYPLVIRFLRGFFQNSELLTGLFVSNLSFFAGLYFLSKTFATKKNWLFLIGLLSFFPTAFYFQVVYSEGLFFLLVVLVFYFCRRQKLWLAALFGGLAALTRLMGVFLFIPLFFTALNSRYKKQIVYSLGPVIGLGLYMFYLWQTVKDPLAFFHDQPVFGEGRSTNLILLPQVYWRYLKIFITADWSFAYFTALIETIFFTVFLVVLSVDLRKQLRSEQKNMALISLSLFSLINILLPTLTGSFVSVPRFTILSLAFFVYLANLKNKFLKTTILLIMACLQIVLLSFFVQGYFIS